MSAPAIVSDLHNRDLPHEPAPVARRLVTEPDDDEAEEGNDGKRGAGAGNAMEDGVSITARATMVIKIITVALLGGVTYLIAQPSAGVFSTATAMMLCSWLYNRYYAGGETQTTHENAAAAQSTHENAAAETGEGEDYNSPAAQRARAKEWAARNRAATPFAAASDHDGNDEVEEEVEEVEEEGRISSRSADVAAQKARAKAWAEQQFSSGNGKKKSPAATTAATSSAASTTPRRRK